MEALEEELDFVINDIESMPESEYKELIKKYPDLLKLNFSAETPKNGIILSTILSYSAGLSPEYDLNFCMKILIR